MSEDARLTANHRVHLVPVVLALANPPWQRNVWLDPSTFENLDHVFHTLFDDFCDADEPDRYLGVSLRSPQAAPGRRHRVPRHRRGMRCADGWPGRGGDEITDISVAVDQTAVSLERRLRGEQRFTAVRAWAVGRSSVGADEGQGAGDESPRVRRRRRPGHRHEPVGVRPVGLGKWLASPG
ncbi:SCO4402 family protein [Streptomyces sp. SAS_269]|uniref:SCO4402 family protein n=1 Tax=Streptomyces sp. SAS_269 TaxID=3412749 RepID=UPI00403CA158